MKTYLNITHNSDRSAIVLSEFPWNGKLNKQLLITANINGSFCQAAVNDLDENMATLIVGGLLAAFPGIKERLEK